MMHSERRLPDMEQWSQSSDSNVIPRRARPGLAELRLHFLADGATLEALATKALDFGGPQYLTPNNPLGALNVKFLGPSMSSVEGTRKVDVRIPGKGIQTPVARGRST